MLNQKMARDRLVKHPMNRGKQMCPYPNGVCPDGMCVRIVSADIDVKRVAHDLT